MSEGAPLGILKSMAVEAAWPLLSEKGTNGKTPY